MPDYLPPGPRGAAALPYLRLMRQSPLNLFKALHRDYGDVSCIQVGPQPLCVVVDPFAIQKILVNDNQYFKKGRFLEMAKDLLGEGLLTSEGEHHQRQRRLIQPMFHRQMIRSYAETMVEWGQTFANRWQEGEVKDFSQEMMKLTLAIVGETLFGANVEQDSVDVGKALETVLDVNIINRPIQRWLRQLPGPTSKHYMDAKNLLDQSIQHIIDQFRQRPPEQTNLIGLLLAATDEDGQGMSDQQVRDEALTLFLAGHETTANALSWTWYLLSQSPRVEALFHKELAEVLQGRAATVDDLPQLTYTRQILTESMRLYPPAWTIGRRVLVDYQIGHFRIPARCVVLPSQYLMHRHSRYYSDPDAFKPERWTPEFKQSLPKFAYFPFGGGPRNCIGEAFAWMEGTLLLATLGQHWQFRLEPDQTVDIHPMVTLRPKNGLKMKLVARA